jgi:hypothetical protein
MNSNTRSLLIGAAAAALMISPTFTSMVPADAANTAAPVAPPAPAAPPAPQTVVADEDNGWTREPVRTFNAGDVKFDDIVGMIIVNVANSGPMTVEMSGAKTRVDGTKVYVSDNTLVVEGTGTNDNTAVWDWKNWFNFSSGDWDRRSDNLYVKVTVPRGTNVNISGLVGNAAIGDTQGTLHMEAAVTKAKIGKVADAKIELGGDGEIDIAEVAGALNLDCGGAAKVRTGNVGSVKADIAGSGDARFGNIAGGLTLGIAGSGEVTAARVNGPTRIEIAGSGNVKIADGVADPLHVEMMGAGDFSFGGMAVDPHVEAVGSGNVWIKSYRGHLDTEGMADVKIGQ